MIIKTDGNSQSSITFTQLKTRVLLSPQQWETERH